MVMAVCGYMEDRLLVGAGDEVLVYRLAVEETVLRKLSSFSVHDSVTCLASHGANFAVGDYSHSIGVYTLREDDTVQLYAM